MSVTLGASYRWGAVLVVVGATALAGAAPVGAIPNCCGGAPAIVPAGSDIPHEHTFGIDSDGFPGGTVTRGGAAAVANPDAVPAGDHQHRDDDVWSVNQNRWRFGEPNFSAWAWDNKALRIRTFAQRGGAPFDSGHAFIDELGYGFRPANPNHLCYRYGTAAGADAPPVVAQGVIGDAFAQWSAITAGDGVTRLTTGIELRQVGSPGALCAGGAQIEVLWQNIAANGETVPGGPGMRITFDCDPDSAGPVGACPAAVSPVWSFGGVAAVGADQLHFRSTALHEIGHAIGLDHTAYGAGANRGATGVMRNGQERGCPAQVCRDAIDEHNSGHAVRDMYSIPTPDFGDAPAPYPTTLATNGGRAATLPYERLQSDPTTPEVTTRELDANAPDTAEFGCHIGGGPFPGTPVLLGYVMNVFDKNAARYAVDDRLFVAIWLDWNGDGDWNEANERLVLESSSAPTWPDDDFPNSQPVDHVIGIPPDTAPRETRMRCRLVYGHDPGASAYLGGSEADGTATGPRGLVPLAASPDNGGEVEDQRVFLIDTDDNGLADSVLTFPEPGELQDADFDTIADGSDNCPAVANAGQENADGDAEGDICDADDDGDGHADVDDDFPLDAAVFLAGDDDADGLTASAESAAGSDPAVQDTDGDGLIDGDEVSLGTNVLLMDSDGDGLLDGVEMSLHTDPLDADTDGDGLGDGLEVALGTDPLRADAPTDSTPPMLSVAAEPSQLWPPNHRLVPVTVTVTASDDSGVPPSVVLVAATSDEPDDGVADGSTTGDIQDADLATLDLSVLLRAERSLLGDGRVYTLTYRATDGAGNETEASALVMVPLSRRP